MITVKDLMRCLLSAVVVVLFFVVVDFLGRGIVYVVVCFVLFYFVFWFTN